MLRALTALTLDRRRRTNLRDMAVGVQGRTVGAEADPWFVPRSTLRLDVSESDSILLGDQPAGIARKAYARAIGALGAAIAKSAIRIKGAGLTDCPIRVQGVLGGLPIVGISGESASCTDAVEAPLGSLALTASDTIDI
jgi:hypothetical protein